MISEKKILLSVDAKGDEILHNVFDMKEVPVGYKKTMDEFVVTFLGTENRHGLFPEVGKVLEMAITFTSGVAASVLANWICAKFINNERNSMWIDKTEVEISADKIKVAIEKCIQNRTQK